MEKKSENAPHVAELLLSAARTGDRSGVIAALADPLSQPNFALFDGSTALIFAAKEGHTSVVEVLLGDERVDRNIVDKEHGYTALMYTAGLGHASVVEVLLGDERVDLDIVDNEGHTIADIASESTSISKLLHAAPRYAEALAQARADAEAKADAAMAALLNEEDMATGTATATPKAKKKKQKKKKNNNYTNNNSDDN